MIASDALVLLAILYAGQEKAATLVEVIAAADYIDHSVLAFEEIEGALARLYPAGFIQFENGLMAPTEKTIQFYRDAIKHRGTVYDELQAVVKYLGAEEWSPGGIPQAANEGVSFALLRRSDFDFAIREYLSR